MKIYENVWKLLQNNQRPHETSCRSQNYNKMKILKKCLTCGTDFVASKISSKYCCRKCERVSQRKREAEKREKERENASADIPSELETKQFLTPKDIAELLDGHWQRSMGSESRIFLDIVVNGIREFLPLTDEIGKLLCFSLRHCSNTVMEVSVLLQGISRILEMVIRLFRAWCHAENKTQKKTSERLNSFEYFFFHLFYFLSSACLRRSCAVQK